MEILVQYGLRSLWILLELLSIQMITESFLPGQESRCRKIGLWALWAGLTLLSCLSLPVPLLMAAGVLGIAVWNGVTASGKPFFRILIALLSCFAGACIDGVLCVLVSALTGVKFADPAWRLLLHFVALTSSKLLHTLISFLVRRFRMPDAAGFVMGKGLFLSLLFPGMGLLLVVAEYEAFHGNTDSSASAVLTCCVLIIANVAVLYLLSRGERADKPQGELAHLHKQMELQTQSILSLEKSYRAQRKSAHEFRHHLQTLRDLLEGEQTEAAKAYIEKLQNTHSTRVLCVNTHHPIVDAVLNQKYQAAVEQSIDVQMQVNDLSQLRLDSEALVVVLANLLDNATEGCERLRGQRNIRCSILLEETLFISVSNTSPPVKIEENTIESTKMPRQDHGYGLPAICNILDELNAEYAFDYKDGWFRFAAEIPLE